MVWPRLSAREDKYWRVRLGLEVYHCKSGCFSLSEMRDGILGIFLCGS
jgi:hypothetical protein